MSTEQSTEQPATSAPPRRIAILIGVALLALALDVTSKILVIANLEGKEPVTVLRGVLYFDVSRNPGAAFSMATGMTWVFSLVAVGVAVAIIWVASRLRSVGWAIGLGLVLAGALGNLVDRIFRAPGPFRGHVVDFISVFRPWGGAFAIFNLADSSISVGAVVIVLMAMLGKDYDGGIARRAKLAEAGQPEPTE
ncbi:MAG TPA: signal peptidase II [Pseudonocardiaceae bacterium]